MISKTLKIGSCTSTAKRRLKSEVVALNECTSEFNELISNRRTSTSNNAFAFSTSSQIQIRENFVWARSLHRHIPFRRFKFEFVSISISIHRDRYEMIWKWHLVIRVRTSPKSNHGIESRNRIAESNHKYLCDSSKNREKITAEVQPTDEIENYWRYLRDRECGERWDRSTSHKNQKQTKPESSLSHETHCRGSSLVIFRWDSENSATPRAILTQVLVGAMLVGSTSCRRPRSSAALNFFLR